MGYLRPGELMIDTGPEGHVGYMCLPCCGYTRTRMTPGSSTGVPGGTQQMMVCALEYCCNLWCDVTGSSYNWASTIPSVASVNTSGLVSCFAPGTCTISSSVRLRLATALCPNTTFSQSAHTTVISVQVSSVDLPSDQVKVTLNGPSGTSGQLLVNWQGPSGNAEIENATQSVGSYTFNPPLGNLVAGQYSGVTAQWTANGATATGSYTKNFDVLGVYRHSQYNTPTESSCIGSGGTAIKSSGPSACTYSNITLKSDFISQSWLNGSGITISYGPEQNEAICAHPPGFNYNFFRPVTAIVPACQSYSVATPR